MTTLYKKIDAEKELLEAFKTIEEGYPAGIKTNGFKHSVM